MKVKKNLFIEMVNRGQINKDQVHVFVKCLKLVLVYRIFIRTNHRLQETKVLELMHTQKH